MAVRRRIRWVARHGLIRRATHRQMRAGDLGARLMADPAIREDPFPYYDQMRAQGRLVSSRLALISAHHDVCTAVLRSPDFGQMSPDRLPGPLRLAMKPRPRSDRATVHAGDGPARAHPLPQAGHPVVRRAGRRRPAHPGRGDRRRTARRDRRVDPGRWRDRRSGGALRQPAAGHRDRRDARSAGGDAPPVPRLGSRRVAVPGHRVELPRLPPLRGRPGRPAPLDAQPLHRDPPRSP